MSVLEPSDEELVTFAESLLRNAGPQLRERHVLEGAIQQQRATWLTLYHAATALKASGAVRAVNG